MTTCKLCSEKFEKTFKYQLYCGTCRAPRKCLNPGCKKLIKTIGKYYCADYHKPIGERACDRPKSGRRRCSWGKYRGIMMRSNWERFFALCLDQIGVKWEYEPEVLRDDNISYKPDFLLSDLNILVEIKPSRLIDSERVAKRINLCWQLGRELHVVTERNMKAYIKALEQHHTLCGLRSAINADEPYHGSSLSSMAIRHLNAAGHLEPHELAGLEKKRLRAREKYIPAPRKPVSESTRKKLSVSNKGRKHSKEVKEKISKSGILAHKNPNRKPHIISERGKLGMCRGESKPGSKLTNDNVKAIRKQYGGEFSTTKLAKIYGVSSRTVTMVIKNRLWFDPDYCPPERLGL